MENKVFRMPSQPCGSPTLDSALVSPSKRSSSKVRPGRIKLFPKSLTASQKNAQKYVFKSSKYPVPNKVKTEFLAPNKNYQACKEA
jgi:hypothetical protein